MTIRSGPFFLAVGVLALVTQGAFAATVQPVPASGNYDGLLVGYDPATGVVTGGYHEERGKGQFSCIFLFQGKFTGPGVAAVTETPDPPDIATSSAEPTLNGTLTIEGTEAILRLSGNPDGCDMEGSDFAGKTDTPAGRSLTKAFPWVKIALVHKPRAHFYPADVAPLPRKGYVTDLDVVGVRKESKGRSLVDYVGGASPVSGWVKTSDLFP